MSLLLFEMSEADYESHTTLRLNVVRPPTFTVSRLMRGDIPTDPLLASRHMGRVRKDYTDSGMPIVSARFRDAVAQHGLTGAMFTPLVVDDGVEPAWLMSITGRCGDLDYSHSEHFTRVYKLPGGGETYQPCLRGFTVDPQSHSGHDFVIPPRVNRRLVSKRAADAMSAERLTNLSFTPISEHEIAERTVFGPGSGDAKSSNTTQADHR
jgi:hypothetical protein